MIIILHQLFLYNKNVYSIIHRPCCTLSLLEEKACTEREVGRGRRARSLRSDLPKLRFEDVLAGGSRSPVAVPEILCSLFARRISTAATRSPPFSRPRRRSARSPLHPPFAVCPGRIILSHPAFRPNTKRGSCKHLPPPSSQLCYRRACERELGRSKKAFPLRGRWI